MNNSTKLIKYPADFDFKQLLEFMRPRFTRGLATVSDTIYSRTFRIDNDRGWFQIQSKSELSALELHIHSENGNSHEELIERVREMFDLNTDLKKVNTILQEDEILRRGMQNGQVPRLPRAFDPFEFTIRAIVGQQITVKAASTIAARFIAHTGIKCPTDYPKGLQYFSPFPAELLQMSLDDTGLNAGKRDTIKAVAAAVMKGEIILTEEQPFEKFYRDFVNVKGIGDWTANYVAMRGLGMHDAFPAGDLGITRALSKNGKQPSHREILKIAERWRPYRSYAALCLWNFNK